MTNATLRGKPDAGNPHVAPAQDYGGTGRFDEGEGAPAKPRRGSLLYNAIRGFVLAATVAGIALAAPAGGDAVAPYGLSPAEAAKWELTFADEFEAPTIDTNKWYAGYRNGQFEYYRRVGAKHPGAYTSPECCYEISNGTLKLRIDEKSPTRPYVGSSCVSCFMTSDHRYGKDRSEATVMKKFGQKYGWFEMRCKVAKGPGLESAFWLHQVDPLHQEFTPEGKPNKAEGALEFDIFEAWGTPTNQVRAQMNVHFTDEGHYGIAEPDPDNAFHVFALEWEEGLAKFYYDGKVVKTYRGKTPQREMFVLMALFHYRHLPGHRETELTYPRDFEVDYVRVFRRRELSAPPREQPVFDIECRSDWVNVKDFGAKGDGKTDDTKAIQAALDKIGPGVTVFFPKGDYVITHMIEIRQNYRIYGGTVLGCGEATKILWKGAAFGRMLRICGFTESRLQGFVLEGNNNAVIGIWSDNEAKFCTETRYNYITVRNCHKVGFLSENDAYDHFSDSEPFFDNCIFENCGTAVSFTSFNDYDFAFKSCLFRNNRENAIHCQSGNFYVMDCRFENNGTDVYSRAHEHPSSIRRSVSVGSGQFFKGLVGVAGVTIENCTIANWRKTDQPCVDFNGSVLALNNTFLHSKPAKIFLREIKGTALSGNTFPTNATLFVAKAYQDSFRHTELPAGKRPALKLATDMYFHRPTARFPTKVFDAKRDFGAKGDDKADDTEAIQKTIDAAIAAGRDAIAYIPTGTYKLTKTIRIANAPCTIGGNGVHTILLWRGDHSEPAMTVTDPQDLRLEYFRIVNAETIVNHGAKWDGLTGPNILHTGGTKPTKVTYDGVVVYGRYQNFGTAERQGLMFQGLKEHDTVDLHDVQGNLRLYDCGDATILGAVCHEGSITVDGPTGKGFLGNMARLATHAAAPLQVRKNGSYTMSDFYNEQGYELLYSFSGSPDLPPGRVTLGLVKIERSYTEAEKKMEKPVEHLIDFDNFNGVVNAFAGQFYKFQNDVAWASITAKGQNAKFNFVCPHFYEMNLSVETNNLAYQEFGAMTFGKCLPHRNGTDPSAVADSIDDFTRLGEIDLELHYK